jgi:Ni,Fe-hydrogenase maturation factor
VEGTIEDGQLLDPHGIVVACEPEVVGDVGFGLSNAVERSVGRAVELVLETIDGLRDA